MPRIGGRDAEIKIDYKRQKLLFDQFYLEYPLSQESEIRPINCKICPLLTSKTQIKNLWSVLRHRLPRFRGKGQSQSVATF